MVCSLCNLLLSKRTWSISGKATTEEDYVTSDPARQKCAKKARWGRDTEQSEGKSIFERKEGSWMRLQSCLDVTETTFFFFFSAVCTQWCLTIPDLLFYNRHCQTGWAYILGCLIKKQSQFSSVWPLVRCLSSYTQPLPPAPIFNTKEP